MSKDVADTVTSVVGSSATTIAGFLALCFMSYTMGVDLGIVMAKGVFLGVLGSVTILPALILVLDKPLEKTRHRSLIPKMDKAAAFITGKYWIFLVLFLVILVPAVIGYTKPPVYYDFTNILSGDIDPEDVRFLEANEKLNEDFGVASAHMILCRSDLTGKDAQKMLGEIEDLDGVEYTLAQGMDTLLAGAKELMEGMAQFDAEGISKIADLFQGDAETLIDRLRALRDLDGSYTSFSGEAQDMPTTVKCIYRMDSIGE